MNRIKGLFDENGQWTEGDLDLESIANQYFYKLFQSSCPDLEAIENVLEAIPLRISEEHNSELTRRFTREEITEVVKGMKPTRAPGSDGI